MTDNELYPGMPNSPETELTAAITASATECWIKNGAALPDAPNILVIGKKSEGPETVRYLYKDGTHVSGMIRGVEGSAKPWGKGTTVARNFTNYDWEAARQRLVGSGSGSIDTYDGGSATSGSATTTIDGGGAS